jgi:hypothetical protein
MPSPPSASPALIVLQITLTFWEDDPQVELALVRGAEILGTDRPVWRIQATSLGVPENLGPDTKLELKLPATALNGLKANLVNESRALPLWLRFAKPHGYLGVLPWERVLTEALDRPVLRLPDLLERAHENRDVLEVALCFDPDPETLPGKASEQIRLVVDTILQASPRAQTRINLFTTSGWTRSFKKTGLGSRVQIHDPDAATFGNVLVRQPNEAAPGGQPPLQSPWSIWMCRALGTRSLDAIYFICDTDMTDFGPALMMSGSPSTKSPLNVWSYMDAMELAALLTQTGAWAALFSSPQGTAGEATLALAADALAHTRPTSVLYQPLRTPEQVLALRAACGFLFSPQAVAAPSPRDGFLYCQPTCVAAHAKLEIRPVLSATELNASAFEKTASLWDRTRAYVTPYIPMVDNFELKQAPNWATAVQRQSELLALEQLRRSSPDVLLSTPQSARAQIDSSARVSNSDESEETLAEIQKVIGDYLRKTEE